MDKLANLLLAVESGELPAQALIEWAMKEIEDGNDSESLHELAWLNDPDRAEAIELFIATARDLSRVLPSGEDRIRLLAKRIASNMNKGIKNLNDGCLELSDISKSLGSPKSLSIFELLAHEQYGHDKVGITAENIRPDILNEVKKYLNDEDPEA